MPSLHGLLQPKLPAVALCDVVLCLRDFYCFVSLCDNEVLTQKRTYISKDRNTDEDDFWYLDSANSGN